MDPLLQDLCGLIMEHFPLILCEGYVFIHISMYICHNLSTSQKAFIRKTVSCGVCLHGRHFKGRVTKFTCLADSFHTSFF